MSFLMAATSPEVSLVAKPVFAVGPITITNSTLMGIIGTSLLIATLFWTVNRIRTKRYNRLSVGILWGFEMLLNTTEEVLGSRAKALKAMPLAVTIFLVIMVNNWLGILPVVGTVTLHGEPVLRGLAADLNFTLALAIITMVTAQVWAIRTHGFGGNLGRYFRNPFTDPLGAFEGILELVAEFSRLIALSMRLFGNIFGGEVLLAVIGFIAAGAAPVVLPIFMLLELFVGAIQAYVFYMLTIVFISLGSSSHHEESQSVGRTGQPITT